MTLQWMYKNVVQTTASCFILSNKIKEEKKERSAVVLLLETLAVILLLSPHCSMLSYLGEDVALFALNVARNIVAV